MNHETIKNIPNGVSDQVTQKKFVSNIGTKKKLSQN